MKKRKRKWIKLGILCSVVILLILGFKIKDHMENPLWYEFKGKLMKVNRLIELSVEVIREVRIIQSGFILKMIK